MDIIIRTLAANKVLAIIYAVTQLLFIVGLSIGFFSDETHYDKLVHFILPATGAPLLFAYLTRLEVLPKTVSNAGMALAIFLLGVGAEAIWEVIEFVLDNTLHSSLQHGNFDTMLDIVMAMLGSAIGAIWYMHRRNKLNF